MESNSDIILKSKAAPAGATPGSVNPGMASQASDNNPATARPAGTNPALFSVDDVSASAHATIDKASSAARPAVDRLASGAHQAVDKLSTAAKSVGKTIDSKGVQLLEAQKRVSEETRAYVRDNPLTSLGLAFGIGYTLSRLFHSR